MVEVEGFILAGGASSRMGRDKSSLRLGGRTFVERVAAALSQVTERVSVVSSRHEGECSGLPVVRDVFADAGALGGIHSALLQARAPWAAVVSCDLPFVTGELLARLVSYAAGVEAVAPVQGDGRPQPLCALYARGPCLEISERLLRAGELRPRVLLKQVGTFWVEFEMLADLAGRELFFRNVNTPADYEEARRALAPPGI